jgi:hypothetical protein
MKKYLMIISAAVLALSFTACNNEPTKKACTFDIAVSEIAATEATVTVTPSDTNAYYYYSVVDAKTFEAYAKDTIVQSIISNIQYYVDAYNQHGIATKFTDFLNKGADTYTFDELNGNTNYVVFAFAVDTLKKAIDGEMFTKPFTTAQVPNVSLDFNVQFTDTAVFVIPNDNKIEYLYTIIETDTLAAYNLAPQQALEQYNEYMAQAYSEHYGMTITLSDLTTTGGLYISFEGAEENGFTLGAEYMFIARAYTGGTFNSDLVTKTFVLSPLASAPARFVEKIDKHTLFLAPKALKVVKFNK